ncbi:XrtB/PEP-CTERM-associated polysaccharide biosynthesis outer membrane protein EpsL [Sideroxydans sp. CL21]|uniref:XrtB/PEP-CTERM-associated polysaccharide biosynthesis outer membrane protein EpsL n=1 Tax=Sideroxydans sp. CL21 TaxID=2600596 RepID=UPI0024BCAF5D|nr:XrtB/PEP-CTERM-associated polysaccharide biosynthesis outer membrane protein EpsL [Sideroxydans sp. CL21]
MTNIASRGMGLVVLLISIPVSADQFDTLSYVVSAGMVYDNNVFRLPSWLDPQSVIGKSTTSDRIQFESIGINFDKKYSNQDVQFKANVTKNNFSTFSFLNYFNTEYSGAWNWNLGERLSGALSDDRTQTLNSFTDIHTYTRNLTTVDTRHLDADWWAESNWHVLLGATDSISTSSQSVINNQSSIAKTAEWGLKYALADGNSMSLFSRNIRGQFINGIPDYVLLADTAYSESQTELRFNWVPSGKSVLSGNLMNINHQYPTFYQRDFSGTQGGVNYLWSISDKTTMNISINRSINTWLDAASSYFINDSASITPVWQIGAKTNMHLSLMRGKANYLAPIESNKTVRHDINRSEEFGLDWSPQRSVKLTATLQNSSRSTNYATYEYADKSANLMLQITF